LQDANEVRGRLNPLQGNVTPIRKPLTKRKSKRVKLSEDTEEEIDIEDESEEGIEDDGEEVYEDDVTGC
jgi:hypothetical protein